VIATSMIEVFVAGLGIVQASSTPMLLLKERRGERVVAPIGLLEAQAIAMPLQGVRPPRPMSHDVFAAVIADLADLGGHLRRVELTDLTDNIFHACLMVDQAGNEHTIDIRPSSRPKPLRRLTNLTLRSGKAESTSPSSRHSKSSSIRWKSTTSGLLQPRIATELAARGALTFVLVQWVRTFVDQLGGR